MPPNLGMTVRESPETSVYGKAWLIRLFWKQETVGSNPTILTISGAGYAKPAILAGKAGHIQWGVGVVDRDWTTTRKAPGVPPI